MSGGPDPGARIDEEWIVDTGPVIILAKIGRLDLLTRLCRAVLLPSPVVQEIRRGPAAGPARRAVEARWGTEVPVRYIRVAVRSVGLLDPGEQSVLTLRCGVRDRAWSWTTGKRGRRHRRCACR